VTVTSTDPTVADSVRLALPGEAGSIAELQRRAWSDQLPQRTADVLLAQLDVSEMADAWRLAITRPPQAQFRVLVAVAQHRVVGFATTIPSPDPDAEPGQDGQIDEFVIDPPAQRRGHGSRLLNACVDTLRADGFSRVTWWVTSTDDVLRGFLSEAGWAPDGGWREIGTDDEAIRVKQIRMHTDISATD
jgi:ribosomal protein S18 acetylase RimI-like enzyme